MKSISQTPLVDRNHVLSEVRDAIELEALSARAMRDRIDGTMWEAIQVLAGAPAVAVTALGKPGYIGMKFAATLASIGVAAGFIHAGEALHGDSGRVRDGDALVAISNSGRTTEVLRFADIADRRGATVIALTGDVHSPLARRSRLVLDISVDREADPLGLAPTASVVAALVCCDALAIGLMLVRGTTSAQFHECHPAGALGERLAGEIG